MSITKRNPKFASWRKSLAAIAVGSVLGSFSSSTLAVEVGGEITGSVESASGEIISNAKVTAKHSTKGVTRSASTNNNGEYTLRNLPIGEYTLTISSDGYTIDESKHNVLIGQPVTLKTTLAPQGGNVDTLVIIGTQVQSLSMSETTGGMSFDDADIDLMPVDANLGFEGMVKMTPGAVDNSAGSEFKGANAISGGSPAENAYYLNGINITQIQQGLGSFRLPWEAIEQVNVQTSGLGAEFGSALGGIVNAVSKSGSNDFEFGFEVTLHPENWYDHPPSVRLPSSYPDVAFYDAQNNQNDEDSFQSYSIWASGPIIEDKLFFYALYNPNVERWERSDNSTFWKTKRESDRWFVNLEWFITDGHSIGVTAFDTSRETTTQNFAYDVTYNEIEDFFGNSYGEDGGTFVGINYHGELTDRITLDIIAGKTEEEEIPRPANDLPLVDDCRTSSNCVTYSVNSDNTIIPQDFSREQLRFDLHIDLDDHQVSLGYDSYEIDVYNNQHPNGLVVGDLDNPDHSSSRGWWAQGIGGTFNLGQEAVSLTADDASPITNGEGFIRRRVRNRFSDSTVESQAFYIQDEWAVSDDLTLNLGARFVSYENTVSSGEAYADLDGNFAPRISAVYTLDDTSSIFASFGRYFQPVAARMNITQGSSSIEWFDYYELDQVDSNGRAVLLADGSPSRGDLVSREYRQIGITDPNLVASKNLEAMYSDQISFGYNTELGGYDAGVRFVYNDLKRSVEDTDYGPVLTAKLAELGINDALGQSSFYVLANPGKEVQVAFDFDQDGDIDEVNLTPDELQLPEAERSYLAWEFTLSGDVSDDLIINASYTWSHSWGNTEGLVKTTNEQADPGWTSDYDYGDALDHAKGNLPNDRRHSLKLHGLYTLSDELTLGFVYRAQSGAPLNKLRPHPEGVDSCAPSSPWNACISQYYIGGFYDENGNPAPRGSQGHLSWSHALDLSLTYQDDSLVEGLSAKVAVYNVFSSNKPVKVYEWIDPDNQANPFEDYMLTDQYQDSRYGSISVRYEF